MNLKNHARAGGDCVCIYWAVCFFKTNYLFIFGCAGSLLLDGLFPSCVERRLLFIEVRGLLIAVASLAAEHGL